MSRARVLADFVGGTTTISGNPTFTGSTVGAGKILQVVKNEITSTSSWTGWNDVITQAITPSATSSKILIQFSGMFGFDYRYAALRLYRDSTQIAKGDAEGSRTPVFIASFATHEISNQLYISENLSGVHLDSPSTTSAITYKINAGHIHATNRTSYNNRPVYDGNQIYFSRGTTSLILTEVAG
tara:strand:- start:24 stop:575 length:552 start_codon:yes stop_codon:yes gene_type:complete